MIEPLKPIEETIFNGERTSFIAPTNGEIMLKINEIIEEVNALTKWSET